VQIIRKPRPERNFTILENAMLRDDELTLKALGLLVRLLSYPDGWRTDYRTLAKQYKRDGETSFRTAYKELEQAGYLTRQKIRDADGRWTTITTIHEDPCSPTHRRRSAPAVIFHPRLSTPENRRS
jgi:hypothetical protein